MDMSDFRPELHIAQQSRRDKLRIQPDLSPSHHHLGVYANNLEQIPGNICYDPSEFCLEMLHFPVNPQSIMPLKASLMVDQGPEKRVTEGPFHNFSRDIQTTFNPSNSVSSDPLSWMANHSNPMSLLDAKPCLGYQELHPPLNNSSSEISNMNCSYQNALQELVTSSNSRSCLEFASLRQKSGDESRNHGPWAVSGSELLLLPAYADQSGLKGPNDFIGRPAEGCNQWTGQVDFVAAKDSDLGLRTIANDNANTQALSLSLSSVPSPKVHDTQIGEKEYSNLSASCGAFGTQASTHRNPGPLGPFTGYAAILRSSKFLRPAQQLLDEICGMARPKNAEICEVPDKIFDEVRVCSEGVINGEPVMKEIAGESSVSSFAFSGSDCKWGQPGGMSCSTDSHWPENLQKKAKLLYMQDEVSKRYKQYHQQMQMVVSSFESVAGLSTATPYVSLALKMIAKHFRCLKNTITDQLKNIKNVLSEELSSPLAGTSKGEASVSMLKFFDQNFQKQKGGAAGGGNLGILEGQHIWRPQRGLPERAVSVLRAWLFGHFLHPYPTDTDKHMLAAQTGLTRNQVSNWFINARVRVWKPMVEEIHMLETKGATETGSEASRTNGITPVEGCDQANESNQSLNRLTMSAIQDKQVECSSLGPSEHASNPHIWNQEKRSRIEYHIPSGVDGSLMGLVPSRRSGIEMGGLGSVSLTLGLRQSAENAQRPALQQEHHFRPHFGGHIIRDFVG